MNKKVYILTWLVVLTTALSIFNVLCTLYKTIDLDTCPYVLSLYVTNIHNFDISEKIVFFIVIFVLVSLLFSSIMSASKIYEKGNNIIEVEATKKDDAIPGFSWKFRNRDFDMNDINFWKNTKYKIEVPEKINLFIDPNYPFVWGYKYGIPVEKQEAQDKIIKTSIAFVALLLIQFLFISIM